MITTDPPHVDPDRDRLTRELLASAREHDDPDRAQELRHRAIILNLEVATRVSRRFRGRGIDDDDLEQVAYLGLCKAVARFTEPSAHGFAAFAVPTISGEIKRHFRDRGWLVRPPRGLQEDVISCRVASDRLTAVLGREPSRADLAHELGLPPDRVASAQAASSGYAGVPYDCGPRGGDGGPAGEPGGARCPYDEVEQRLLLDGLLARLDARDRAVVDLRFRDGATQREIGQVVGLSQMQVSRILARVLETLRAQLEAEEPAMAARSTA